MKFCKNLQRVIEISDPAWSPYWLNYKLLKKIIGDLPPASSNNVLSESTASAQRSSEQPTIPQEQEQQRGDATTEGVPVRASHDRQSGSPKVSLSTAGEEAKSPIAKSPGEVAFFKLLHGELKKSQYFFDRTCDEVSIRVERVKKGMEMMKDQKVHMANEKWKPMAKAIYHLYRDLLLLETFAIMTYVGFSKILKKHDKCTGLKTSKAFMESIVNKASFTHYPRLMDMIARCESLYEEISKTLESEGRQALSEDESLFISMIHRLNKQFLESDENIDSQRPKKKRKFASFAASGAGSVGTKVLRQLVEENDAKPRAKEKDSEDDAKSIESDDDANTTKSPAKSGKRSTDPTPAKAARTE